jgi:hypothetical protein
MTDLIVTMGNKQLVLKDVDPDVEQAIAYFQKENETLTSRVTELEDDIKGIEEQNEDLAAQKTEWEEYKEKSLPAEEVESLVANETKARIEAISQIRTRKPDFVADPGLGVQGLQELAIKAIAPELSLEGKDAATIAGIWQGILAVPVAPPQQPEIQLPSGTGDRSSQNEGENYVQETYNLAGRFK